MARDVRAGEMRVLVLAVTLAVAALTAVGFFADRLNGGFARDARQMLGGDAVLASDQPLPEDFATDARSQGLSVSSSLTFPSMARASELQGGGSRLVAVKAVDEGYPLRGVMRVQTALDGPVQALTHGPSPGSVWVEAGVLDALRLQVGDPLLLGDASFKIAHIIRSEPDRGGGFMSFSPRVMLHQADLAATQLVQPASRIRYRFAVASRAQDLAGIEPFQAWAQKEIDRRGLRNVRLESLDSGRPEFSQTLDRATQFLNLVALLAAMLSSVAVAIVSRDFALRRLNDCAMLRVLGQSQRQIAAQYGVEFAAAGLIASLLGVALGYAVHHVFVALLAGFFNVDLPPATAAPALLGLGVGLTLLLGFGLPPVLQLARVPPLRVIRRDIGGPKPLSSMVFLAGVSGFLGLLVVVADDLRLGLMAVGGFAGAGLIFMGLGGGSVMLLRRIVWPTYAPRWLVLATRHVTARPGYTVMQVCALSLGLMALVLLILLRTDLIDSWRQATPVDAPNRFVLSIQPDQTQAFQAFLREQQVTQFDWYPMLRARLVSVNGALVRADDYSGLRSKALVEREFNLSHSAQLPSHNLLSAGQWVAERADEWSIEKGLAEELGLHLGDALSFDMAGQAVHGRITSIRKLNWGSMRVNFYVMRPVSQWPDAVPTYVAAFRAPAQQPQFDRDLSRLFPNVTHVDVSASLEQIQSVLNQVIRAVEFLFAFTLATGWVVLFAAVSATRSSRAREFAVMRALGASRQLLTQVQRAELLGVGALAGLLASLAAMALGWGLAEFVFEFNWRPTPWVALAGAAAGALLAWAAGWWGLRGVLRQPVVETLRQAAQD